MRTGDLRASGPLRTADLLGAGSDAAHRPGGVGADVPGDGRSALRTGPRGVALLLPEAGGESADSRPVPGGGKRAPGTRGADGADVGAPRCLGPDGGPCFDAAVPRGGYAWWYVDALSDDGTHGLTIIAFVGSVFSPYYAWARGRGLGEPENHVALNVALYGPRARWAMTERGRAALARDATSYRVGRSSLTWDGNALSIGIDEIAVPIPRRVRGLVRVHPTALPARLFVLDPARRHLWAPLAPHARVEVQMRDPALSWSGPGYLDSNAGSEPLEDAFRFWTWSRATMRAGTGVLYDAERRDGSALSLALLFRPDGTVVERDCPPVARLPGTLWRMPRPTRADAGMKPQLVRTLEDAPFYARSEVASRLWGEQARGVHEALALDRFRQAWVKLLLPFRMPRLG